VTVGLGARLATLAFGDRARRAVGDARRDLAATALPDAVAARLRVPLGARRRAWRLRAMDAAVSATLAGDTHPCLVRSLALLGEARRLGFAPSLVLGVRRGASGLESHAWLVLDGHPFLEAPETPGTWETLAVLPEGSPPYGR
jgi:hypothetical protein